MTNVKVTELSALAAADSASTDVLPVVDVSADATKKLAISDLHRSVPDGTLSAPGIAFQSDLNCGMYRSGTDAIALVTNGAARILIDATGNVTIPNDLTVQGATTFITSQTVQIEDKNIELGVVSTPTDVTADGGGITLKGATDKTIKWINSTGAWTFNQPVNVTGGEDILIKVESTDRYAHIELADNAATSRITTDGNTGTLRLRADNGNAVANSAIQFEVDGDTKMFINSDGNVGIGDAAPSQKLNVAGNVMLEGSDQFLYLTNVGTGNSGIYVRGNTSGSYLRSHSTGSFTWEVTGSEKMRIDSSGNVGIGTEGPDALLTAKASSGKIARFRTADTNFFGVDIGTNGSDYTFIESIKGGTGSYKPLAFFVGGNRAMDIDTDGNVGIGTDQPEEILHVAAASEAVNTRDGVMFQSTSSLAADTGLPLVFTSHIGNIANYGVASIAGRKENATSGNAAGYLQFSTGNSAGAISEAMRINSDGNVGIGTTQPGSKLEINYNATNAANAGLRLRSADTNESFLSLGVSTSLGKACITSSENGTGTVLPIAFSVGSSSTDERMRIDTSGRLLLGTTTSTFDNAKLQVAGTNSSNYISILNTTASDLQDYGWSILHFRRTQSGGEESSSATISGRHDGTADDQKGVLTFSTNDGNDSNSPTERVRIDSSGRVGIGTTSPSVNGVHVRNSNEVFLRLDHSTTNTWDISNDSNLKFARGGTERMRIDSSGDVLVGKTTTALTTVGTRISSGFISTAASSSSTNLGTNSGGAISLANTNSTDNNFSNIGAYNSNGLVVNQINFINTSHSSRTGEIGFSTHNGSSLTERMRIDSSGRLLIGATLNYASANCDDLQVGNTGTSATGITIGSGDQGQIAFANSTDNRAGLVHYQHTDDSMRFYTNGPTNERMRIDSTGTVLIGGTSTADDDHAHIQPDGTIEVRRASGGNDAIIVREGSTLSWLVEADGRCQSFNVGNLAFLAYDTESTGATDSAYAAMGSISGEARITGGHSGTGDTPLVFRTSDGGTEEERMRIKGYGQIYTYADSVNAFAVGTSGSTSATNACIYLQAGATGIDTGTITFRVQCNGDVDNTNNSYGAISDIKLKENIVDANSQWSDIKSIQIRNYNYKKETGLATHTQIGVIAQEIESISPGLVTDTPDVGNDGNELDTTTKSVNYSVLYMKAVKALQEAMERIESLETRIAALES